MTHFDVLRQSWIPAEGIDGVVKEYGILDILLQAKSLRSIVDSSPLFQYGMYRLLIALLSDAIRPRNIDDLLELFEQGEFPLELLNNYIAECEKDGPCFDLFDKHKPFLQSAYDEDLDKTIRSVALLAYELPSGNNTTHFDHRAESEHAFCPEICARALTAINVFCTAGLQGPSGINGAPPWYVLVRGGNLFETLILNIWIPNLELPFDDPPIAWRNRSRIIPGQSVKRTSYLYGLTWQPRRILLQPLEENGVCSYSGKLSNVMIRQMYFQKGWKFEGYALWTDPHTPRSISEDAVSSVKPREGKAVWRDLAPFLLSTDSPTSPSKNRFFRPATVHQYIIGLMNEINPAHHDFLQVEAYGLVTSQAKLISWVYDVLSIAPEIAEDEMRAALFVEELMLVEQINNLIKRALRNADMDERSIEYAEVLFLNQVQVGIFGEFQSGLATTDTSVDDWRESIIKNWRSKVNHIARDVFEKALDRNGTTAKLLEKSVKSRGVFYGQLKKKIAMREVQGNG